MAEETSDPDLCYICEVNKLNFKTSCGHYFCEPCLMKWVAKSKTCPTCRHPIDILTIDINVRLIWQVLFLIFLICERHFLDININIFYTMCFIEVTVCIVSMWKSKIKWVANHPRNYM